MFDRPVFFVPPPLLSAIGGKESLYENQTDLNTDNFNFNDLTSATSEQLAAINSINKLIPVLQVR